MWANMKRTAAPVATQPIVTVGLVVVTQKSNTNAASLVCHHHLTTVGVVCKSSTAATNIVGMDV